MKAEEIRALDSAALKTRISEMEEERFRLKFRSATEALEVPLRLRSIRRDIARLYTVQHERALGLTREVKEKVTAKKAAKKKVTAKKAAKKKVTAKKAVKKKLTAKKAPAKKAAAKKAASKKATKASGR